MTRRDAAAALAMAVFGLAAPGAFAHHSVSRAFDHQQRIRLVGIIKRVKWIYPHTYFFLEVPQANGSIVEWRLESLPTAMFARIGLSKERLLGGDTVAIEALRARDGSQHFAWVLNIEFPHGRCYHIDDEAAQSAS